MTQKTKRTLRTALFFFLLMGMQNAFGGLPGDVDQNNKIDLGDAIYAIQVNAGIRGQPFADYNVTTFFPIHFGDFWTFSQNEGGTQTWSVAPVHETVNGVQTFRLNYGGGDYDCFTTDLQGLWVHKNEDPYGTVVFNPPVWNSPYRFEVGQTHQSSFNGIYTSSGQTFTVSGHFTMSALTIEEVTVPAGVFPNCLKMMKSAQFRILNGSTIVGYSGYTEICWYAPNVGMVRWDRHTVDGGNYERQLISATVNSVSYPIQ